MLCSSSGSPWLSRIALHVVRSPPFFSAQPFTVPCCTSSVCHGKPNFVFLPLRALVKVSHTSCGILLWSLFHEHFRCALEPFVVEIDLAKIALSCHFALDFICHKEGAYDSAWRFIGHYCPPTFFYLMWHHCHSCGIVIFFLWLAPSLQFFHLSWYGGHPSLRSVHLWMM